MMKRKCAIGILAFCLMLVTQLAGAGLFKCKDSRNKIVYQDKPCQDLSTAPLSSGLAHLGGKGDEQAFLWTATSPKGTAHLMGSLHFGNDTLYPLRAAVMEPFKAADALVVEASLDSLDTAQLSEKLGNKGIYPDGSTLQSHLKPGTWNKLVEMGKRVGVAEETLQLLKPWRASLLIGQAAPKIEGFDQALAVEKTLTRDAGGKKPVIELQSSEQQIGWLDGLSEEEQEQWLLQTLQDLSSHGEGFKERAVAWEKGDADTMDAITRRSFDAGPIGAKLYQTLVVARAKALADKIDELSADGRSYFVILGADTLGGEKGVLKLLEERGYKLTQR